MNSLDVGVECKQSHLVKCSFDHKKMPCQSLQKNKPMWVSVWQACIFSHMTKIPDIKAYHIGILTHNWVKHHAENRETTRDWYIQGIVSVNPLVAMGLRRMKPVTKHRTKHRSIGAWPSQMNTMGINTTNFISLLTNLRNGMQMFSSEEEEIWLTTTLKKRLRSSSY